MTLTERFLDMVRNFKSESKVRLDMDYVKNGPRHHLCIFSATEFLKPKVYREGLEYRFNSQREYHLVPSDKVPEAWLSK